MARGKVVITPSEVIATIKRSAFPNLVIEGDNDAIAFRKLEELCSDISLELFPVGGRSAVIEVFRRRGELAGGPAVLYSMDQDTWVISGIPAEFKHNDILFTEGYSIENDLYRDANLDRLMTVGERQIFLKELNEFLDWHAIALFRFLNSEPEQLDVSVSRALHPVTRPALIQLRRGEKFPTDLKKKLINEHEKILRGKSLIDLLCRQVGRPGRNPRHSKLALIEIGSMANGNILRSHFNLIAKRFGSSSRI